MFKKAALMGIVFLFLMISVHAAEDFSILNSRNSIPVCGCTATEDFVSILNQNSGVESKTFVVTDVVQESSVVAVSPSTYTISHGGDAAVFTSSTPSIFSLDQGQTGTFKNVIAVPCGIIGDFSLTTQIATGDGVFKQLNQVVSVQDCVNIAVQPIVSQQQVCPCSPSQFSFRITNSGTFVETYKVEVNHWLGEYIALSAHPVTLAPGATTVVQMFVNSPCDVYGYQEIPISVIAENTQQVTPLVFELNLDQDCYDYEVAFGKEIVPSNVSVDFEAYAGSYSLCEKESLIVPILVKHTSNISNAYSVEFDGQGVAGIDSTEFSLNPNQQTFIRVLLQPGEGVNVSTSLPVDITTLFGEYKKSGVLNVKIESCYFPQIVENKAKINYSGILSFFDVENIGTQNAVYNVSVSGEDWISVRDTLLVIEPGKVAQVGVQTVPDETVEEGRYSARLSFVSQNGAIYERDIEFNLVDTSKNLQRTLTAVFFIGLFFIVLGYLLIPREIFNFLKKKKTTTKKVKKVAKKKGPIKNLYFYIILAVVAIALLTSVVVFKDKILPFLGSEEGEIAKPVIISSGAEQEAGELTFVDTIKEKLKPISDKIPFFWYIVLGLLVVILIIIISEFQKRRKKKTSDVIETPKEVEEVKEIKEEPKEAPKEVKKELKAITQKEPSQGFKNWKRYLVIIGLLILIALGYLFWPQLSGLIPEKAEPVKEVVKEVAAETGPGFFTTYWKFIVLGLVILAVIIIIWEIFRRRKVKGSIQDFVESEEIEEPVKEKEIKKEVKKEAKKKAKKEKKSKQTKEPGKWKVILLPLIILAILLLGIVAYRAFVLPQEGTQEPVQEDPVKEPTKEPVKQVPKEEIKCDITIDQGTTHTLDLSASFNDPDMDLLDFQTTTPKNLEVVIEGSEAQLTPKEGFTGNDFIVISADDGKGGKATSGIINLCVQKVSLPKIRALSSSLGEKMESFNNKVLTFTQAYKIFILVGFGILVFLILLIYYRKPILHFLEEEEKPVRKKRKSK